MIRLFILLCALPLASVAQEQLFLFDGTNETPVGAIVPLPDTAPGDTVQTRFRVRNNSVAAIQVNTITLSGTAFSLAAVPDLPYTLAPGTFVDFRIAFIPAFLASFSATLQVDTISSILIGNAVSSVVVSTGSMTLASGSTVEYGRVQQGTSVSKTFTLLNGGSSAVAVSTISVAGTGFHIVGGPSVPLQLAPAQTATLQIVMDAQFAQEYDGALAVDQRSFLLHGTGYLLPLPAATISFDSTSPTSQSQVNVSIQLASPAQSSANGLLTMTFLPGVAGVSDDPAIQFMAGNPRLAAVQVTAGDANVLIANQKQFAFQTGTTAGTITFTLTLSNTVSQQAEVSITPSIVGLAHASVARRIDGLDVSLGGFDNTYSASQLSFTFYDTKGNAVQPGAIPVDAASAFHQYFSATTAGGAFVLLARFPVTGNTATINAADVTIVNSAGSTHSSRIMF